LELCQLEDDKTLLISRAAPYTSRCVLRWSRACGTPLRVLSRRTVISSPVTFPSLPTACHPVPDRTFPKSGELIFYFPGIPGFFKREGSPPRILLRTRRLSPGNTKRSLSPFSPLSPLYASRERYENEEGDCRHVRFVGIYTYYIFHLTCRTYNAQSRADHPLAPSRCNYVLDKPMFDSRIENFTNGRPSSEISHSDVYSDAPSR